MGEAFLDFLKIMNVLCLKPKFSFDQFTNYSGEDFTVSHIPNYHSSSSGSAHILWSAGTHWLHNQTRRAVRPFLLRYHLTIISKFSKTRLRWKQSYLTPRFEPPKDSQAPARTVELTYQSDTLFFTLNGNSHSHWVFIGSVEHIVSLTWTALHWVAETENKEEILAWSWNGKEKKNYTNFQSVGGLNSSYVGDVFVFVYSLFGSIMSQ